MSEQACVCGGMFACVLCVCVCVCVRMHVCVCLAGGQEG